MDALPLPSSVAQLACSAQDWTAVHPHATLLIFVPILVLILYRLTQPALIPGKPHAVLFLFSDSAYPQPRSSIHSPFSHLRARWQWFKHARARGLTSRGLADQIRFDHNIDWAAGERPKKGDLLCSWDRVFEWDDDCIDMAALERMRNIGDPLSEKVLDCFVNSGQSKHGGAHDTMERVAQHVVEKGRDGKDVVAQFWSAIDRRPPPGCGALSLEWYRSNDLLSDKEAAQFGHSKADVELIRQPGWTPAQEEAFEGRLTAEDIRKIDEEEARILQRGRLAFGRYGPNMHLGLLLVGLAGGFASPRITDVLKSTGYLVPARTKRTAKPDEDVLLQRLHEYIEKGRHNVKDRIAGQGVAPSPPKVPSGKLDVPSEATNERTFKRLLETMTFILDLMETQDSLLPPRARSNAEALATELTADRLLEQGGKGWLACCRVRFLHTAVRKRLHGAGYKGGYSAAESGLAINQEDLLATLCAFSVAPLWALQRLGLPPTQQERQDLVAFWRHVGFYMGIEPRLLRRHFRDAAAAERTFCCISSHHFLPFAGLTDGYSEPPPSIPSTFGPKMAKRMLDDKAMDASMTQRMTSLSSRLDFSQGPALPLLWAVADRPPGHMAFVTLCSLGRFILGPGLANATCLPATTTWQFITMRIRLFILAYPVLFGTYSPRKAWASELRITWVPLIRRAVVFCSQGKRTTFATSKDGSHTDNYSQFVLDPNVGKHIVRRYRQLLTEMVFVSMLGGLVLLGGMTWIWLVSIDILQRHGIQVMTSLASNAFFFPSFAACV